MRIKICRKEAKEAKYWFELTEPKDKGILEKEALLNEASELMKIFGAIIHKSKAIKEY
ncbi:MAG: hypothetical protein NC927_00365 [Candidatus Omnitrophica bacterium]|nr:hypothetical protein [Candidatus Omnitrophota bacterium]